MGDLESIRQNLRSIHVGVWKYIPAELRILIERVDDIEKEISEAREALDSIKILCLFFFILYIIKEIFF